MRALLVAGVLALAGFAFVSSASVSPASAQLVVDTPIGGVRVGPSQRRHYGEYDRRRYRGDYDRRRHQTYGYSQRERGCSTTIVRRSDGSTTRIQRC
jgi:hypothetical protein